MKKLSVKEYKSLIKKKRTVEIKSPYELVYAVFIELGYEKKSKSYFRKNASAILENLRTQCWEAFLPLEKKFTFQMLDTLVDQDLVDQNMTPMEAITWYVEEYTDYLYALILSNTQSRRSRAGKEFEAIIELILVGAGISFNSQGNIGKPEFLDKGLGKSVDFVLPGVVQYFINPYNTILLSAKTTLRERWQEVPEEMNRTGAGEMFLFTLDEKISEEVLKTLKAMNIQVVTTDSIKKQFYLPYSQVLNFESFIEICLKVSEKWRNYPYSSKERQQIIQHLNNEILKSQDKNFLKNYYEDKLKSLEETSSQAFS